MASLAVSVSVSLSVFPSASVSTCVRWQRVGVFTLISVLLGEFSLISTIEMFMKQDDSLVS